MDKKNTPFTNHHFQLQEGDMIYAFTDGFPDQLGGPGRKKFNYQPFKELLLSISKLAPDIQQIRINEAHVNWMANKVDQTDDILVMGIRYAT